MEMKEFNSKFPGSYRDPGTPIWEENNKHHHMNSDEQWSFCRAPHEIMKRQVYTSHVFEVKDPRTSKAWEWGEV